MKHFFYILILLPAFAHAQVENLKFCSEFEREAFSRIDSSDSPKDAFRLFFASDSNLTSAQFDSVYNNIFSFNNEHNLRRGPRFLFDEVQNHFFAEYSNNPNMHSLFADSIFSCVTGSALISYYLELNGFDYTIEEMPYHVFLTVEYRNRKYILETTDTEYGFLPDIRVNRRNYFPDTIDNSYIFKEIGEYSHLENGQIVVKGTVNLKELAGLNYYNTAITHINSKDYLRAAIQLQKAYYLYPSKRIKEATKYSILQVLNDESIDKSKKIEFYEMLVRLTYNYSSQ